MDMIRSLSYGSAGGVRLPGSRHSIYSCRALTISSALDTEQLNAARRLRREQRRVVQRGENVLRAKQMHLARLEYEGRDETTPSSSVQPRSSRGKSQAAFIGCSGWYYRHWAGGFYPTGLSSSAWFAHYARNFRTVELNAPFYSWPTIKTVGVWNRQVGRREFTYSIKVNELITHIKRFARTDTLVQDFGMIADLLGDRFGCFLFQLPPSFRYSRPALKRILRQLDSKRRNVVEFRHLSWWDERVFHAFRDSGTIFCSTSGPRLPDALIRTADDVYIRFHGKDKWYRHNYSREELAVWTERIQGIGASRVWAYFNNDRDGYALDNARELRRQLAAPS